MSRRTRGTQGHNWPGMFLAPPPGATFHMRSDFLYAIGAGMPVTRSSAIEVAYALGRTSHPVKPR